MIQLVELSIEVTNECTLACIHCSSGSTPKKLRNELTYKEHMALIEDARHIGATELSLSGGNPLLCHHLTKLIDRATELEYERILIYTTGHSHLGHVIGNWPGIHRVLSNDKVTWIFSFHTTDVIVNDYIMGAHGATDSIISSMKWLIQQGQTVEVHMVPMKPNYRDIPSVRKFCANIGVKKLSLLRFVPQTRGKLNVDVLGMDKAEFIDMQLIIHKELQEESSTEVRLGCPIDFRHALGLVPEKTKMCHAGDDLILVRPNGDVHPCAAWKSLPSDSNVRQSTISHIWHNSVTYQKIRWFKSEQPNGVAGCGTCSRVKGCVTGCLAQRLHANGSQSLDDLWTGRGDPLCPGLPEVIE